MPLFVNKNQIFAHQVHLLEHKLRSKEERILELETENAILHLRLAECLGKLRQDQEGESKAQNSHQHPRNAQKKFRSALARLLPEVQAVKQDLSEVFAVYLSFATELEEQSKQLLEKVEQASCLLNGHHGDEVQDLRARVAALERSLQEERERCRVERQRRKELHNTLVELRGNIRVHCRVRPVLPFDHVQLSPTSGSGRVSSEEVVSAISDDTVMVNCIKPGMPLQTKMFEFERVHGPEDSHQAVFDEVKPLLMSLLDGYNVCIMAYGQTGSGKTYTMMGSQPPQGHSGMQEDMQQGIIPKAAAELFGLISEKPAESHTVEVSVTEVYNNEVFDLLARDDQGSTAGRRRDVITTSCGTSQVVSLTCVPVCNASEVLQVIGSVLKLRTHCPTLIHTDSSRSHLIVTLTISSESPNAVALARRLQSAKMDMRHSTQKEWWSPRCRRANLATRQSPDELFVSCASSPCPSPSHSPCPSPRPRMSQAPFRTKLQLVDLAGSECVGMSGVSGAALWEVSCINRSLSALSDVLGALAEQRPHIPYRNSKLTHVLQDAIGGDAKLLLMLCVSPTHRFVTESLQSLGLGTRARQVQRGPPRRKTNTLKVK